MSNGPRSGLRSPYPGIQYHTGKSRPWEARVQVNGKTKYVGMYATPEEALAAQKSIRGELNLATGREVRRNKGSGIGQDG